MKGFQGPFHHEWHSRSNEYGQIRQRRQQNRFTTDSFARLRKQNSLVEVAVLLNGIDVSDSALCTVISGRDSALQSAQRPSASLRETNISLAMPFP